MQEFWIIITSIRIFDVIDIMLVAGLFYLLLMLLRRTRSQLALRGLVGLLLVSFLMYFLARLTHLSAVAFIFDKFWIVLIIVFIAIFQHELRGALTELGQFKLFRAIFAGGREFLDELVSAAVILSKKNIGALIVIERINPLRVYADTGIPLDAEISDELLRTIFMPNTPLHDGAVIVMNERIASAGAILPLSESATLRKDLGTRHRAALGLSEATDAIVIVVSEETGVITLAVRGQFEYGLTADTLKKTLYELLQTKDRE